MVKLNKVISIKDISDFNSQNKNNNAIEINSIMLMNNDKFMQAYENKLISSGMHIHYNNSSINYYKMVAIDWLCNTFGVDSITDSQTDTTYYCLETGDIYNTTICFNGNDWFFTSFGDLVEKYESIEEY